MEAPLHMLEIIEVDNVFQSLEQALLLRTGQEEDAQVGAGRIQQIVTSTVTGTGRTRLANLDRGGHGVRS
jgi:hypothetical protein